MKTEKNQQQYQLLARMQSSENSHSLLTGMKHGATTLENILAGFFFSHFFLNKTKKKMPCQCRRPRRQGSLLWSEDPLEEQMASCFNILAWKIPWTEVPFGLQSKGSQTDMTEPSSTATTF